MQTKFTFVGNKSRTKEQLQTLMYTEEMDLWIAETLMEQSRLQSEDVLRRQNQQLDHQNQPNQFENQQYDQHEHLAEDSSINVNGSEILQRNVLPDI